MKNKIAVKIISIILITLLALTSGLMFYSLILFSNLEKFYMIIALILVIYIGLIVSYFLNRCYRNKNFKGFITASVFSIIFIICFGTGGYLVYNVYGKLSDFNKNYITYSTSLISFNDKYSDIKDVKNLKIGVIKNEDDTELYVLPMEVIKKYSLNKTNEISKYNSVIDLINALYDEEVDVIFINGNYKDIFQSLDEYSNIGKKAIEITSYSKKIEKTEVESDITTSEVKTLTEPFTILLLGVDSEKDGLDKNAAFNGDTIMLITFNPETLNATMFSIPRDTYVKVACGNRQLQKINTSAYGGSSCVIKTVENMTGINIDYYAKINFKGVVSLVDALGGVTVDVPYSFCEQNSSREWGKNAVFVYEGTQTLNGEQALALSRNRHYPSDSSSMRSTCPDFGDGVRNDFVRGQNQQLVVSAMLEKIKTIKSANTFMNILDIVSKNIDTNLTTDQMISFYDVVKTIIAAKSIDVVNIQKTLLTGYDMNLYETNAGIRYAFFNWKGSLNKIVEAMKINLGLKSETVIKKFSFSINSPYEQKVIGSGSYNETKVKLVPNFVSYTISEAKAWGVSNNITVNILNQETNQEIDSDYENYEFGSQSVHEKVLVLKAGNTINLYYKLKVLEDEEVNAEE